MGKGDRSVINSFNFSEELNVDPGIIFSLIVLRYLGETSQPIVPGGTLESSFGI